jgi:two-component system sensor kinase FixL
MPDQASLEAALEDLSEREALNAEAQRIARIGTFVFDFGTGTTTRSEEVKRLWPLEDESKLGIAQVIAPVHPDDRERIAGAYERLARQGGVIDEEVRVVLANGELRYVHVRGEAIRLAHRKLPVAVGTVQDVTERRHAQETISAQNARLKEMQAELIFLARQSAMGTMAATLAHELNQPLTAISNYARGLGRKLETSGDLSAMAEILEALNENALRAGEIIRRMREMAREGSLRKEQLDVGEMIRETARFAGLGRECVEFDFDIRHSRKVSADRIQIQQVLVNLLRNACEAVEQAGGGGITISTKDDDPDVTICVTDTGTGIDPAIFPSLFEAKVSTKPEGMGIGLSISRTIIEAHGGRIWAENIGGGARFCFTLPGE